MMDVRPPALARWILSRRVSGLIGEAVEGDLAERYHRDRLDHGPLVARRNYWREVLSPALSNLDSQARSLDPAPGGSPRSTNREYFMTSIFRDIKHAFRVLAKSPGFTAIAILSLALGIGPNTAIFSMVNATLLNGPDGENPETLVDMYNLGDDGDWYFSGFWLVERIREDAGSVFDGVAAWVGMGAAVEEDGVPRPIVYELVTGNFFDVLQVNPAMGRFFAPEEDETPGTHPVAVVSHGYWQSRMGATPDVVGAELRINGRPYTVIGVAPKGFTSKSLPGVQSDMWLPYNMYPHLAPGQPGNGNLGITGRVAEGVEIAQALATVDGLSTRIDEERKARGSEDDFVLRAFPWTDMYMHPSMDRPLVAIAALLLTVVALVLLVACINLAGFLLARATDRRREVAVRLAMGATRGDVMRQLLVESTMLGLAGGAIGLGLGLWTARAFTRLDLPLPIPMNVDLGLDPAVLLFTVGASLLAGVAFGLTPALQASRAPVAAVLRDEGLSVTGTRSGIGLRGALVVGQMALSVMLLVAAGLFIQSLRAATQIDPGFDTGPAAVVAIDGGASGYEGTEQFVPDFEQLVRNLEARPEISSVTATGRLPLDLGVSVVFYDIPGVAPPEGRDNHRIEFNTVTMNYFETMDVPIVDGRVFEEQDRADGAPVAIVSRAMAEQLWPGESAVGRTLLPTRDPENPVTIIGVAEDVKIWNLEEPPRQYLYRPYAQSPTTYPRMIVRGTVAPERIGQIVVEEGKRVNPQMFMPDVKTMEGHLGYILFMPRMAATLIGGFALLALLLSVIGLYGVVSFGVARRTREMGVRISLGARSQDVVGLVVRGGVKLAVLGAAAGVIGSLAASRFLADYLIGGSSMDPLTLVGVPVLLLAVAGLAAYMPARRASRVNPIEALRAD
jgi:predicted permease